VLVVQKPISQTCDIYSHRRKMVVYYFHFQSFATFAFGGNFAKIIQLQIGAKFDISRIEVT
jgi:hypothetical protein